MGLTWPSTVKNANQYRRIDQGWDLQFDVGLPLLAVEGGIIGYGHNAPGFGDPYPIIHLDRPIAGFSAIYYGHNHPDVVEGTRVAQGHPIAHTLAHPGGNASGDPGWLEIGFYPPQPGTGWTQAGQTMHDLLIDAPVWGQTEDGEAMAFSPEALTQLDQNNSKWTYEDQGFLKQAMAEMEARLVAHIDKVCGKST